MYLPLFCLLTVLVPKLNMLIYIIAVLVCEIDNTVFISKYSILVAIFLDLELLFSSSLVSASCIIISFYHVLWLVLLFVLLPLPIFCQHRPFYKFSC